MNADEGDIVLKVYLLQILMGRSPLSPKSSIRSSFGA